MNRLHIAAEQIKQYLSENEEAGGTIDGIVVGESGESVSIEFELSRDHFNSMIEGYIDRTIDVCRNVLTSADMDVREINDVLMVGGSTRIPLVQERLADFFGIEPASHINPDEVVAHGAAIQAAMLSGAIHKGEVQDAQLAENAAPIDLGFSDEGVPAGGSALLLDVTPATLRIATAGGFSEPFLEKNSPIPIERTSIFTTAQPNQTRVVIQCCRGPERRYEDNELLGSLILDDIPPGDRGEAQIEVTFRVDPDCILHVRAKDLRSNQEVEAKLNIIGAPVEDELSHDHLPAPQALSKDEKKAEKQRLKAEKKAQKEQAKLEKKARKGK